MTQGMPSPLAAFVDEAIALETTAPTTDMQRWVLAAYPENEREILPSGWINGAERLTRETPSR